MPRRAVHTGLVARVDVLLWAATPALAARHQLTFDHALGAEEDRDLAVQPLGRGGHEDAEGLFQRRLHFGPAHDLGEVWRPDFFFTLRDEDEVHRRLPARTADGVQRSE